MFFTAKIDLFMVNSPAREELRRTIVALREQGVSTPEICRELALNSDTVIKLLLEGAPLVPNRVLLAPKQPVGRPRKVEAPEVLSQIAQLVAREDPQRELSLWTFSDIYRALGDSDLRSLSDDTLRRYLSQQGFTFQSQLRQVIGEGVIPHAVEDAVSQRRSILYVVTHQVYRPVDGPTTTLIAGVTSSNRIAFMGKSQGRLSPKMLLEYLLGLLTLHPDRQVVVIAQREGVYRSVVTKFARLLSHRLSVYLSGGG